MDIKLLSWNVNGIRAAQRKGFLEWFYQADPDILAVQEIRATPEQMDVELREPNGYYTYWYPAEKKGYSGVGLFSKQKPLHVQYGLGIEEFDNEGRTMIIEYPHFTLINAYFPSGTRGLNRVDFKMAYNDAFLETCERIRGKQHSTPLIFCGDVNTAHQEIDLTYPKANENTSGFMPIERAWLDKIFGMGYVDTFRHFYPDETERYSWWTSRSNARERNVGWRIDYVIVTEDLVPNLKDACILSDVLGSDHCPVGVDLRFTD